MNVRTLPSGTVTFAFTDIEGSTRLLRDLGDAYADVLTVHDLVLRDVWARHGGIELGTEGDSFFVVFDDADRALRAAAHAQRAVNDASELVAVGLRIRIGVHTGLARPIEGQYRALCVHQAARVESCARGGQIYTTDETLERCPRTSDAYSTRMLGRFRVRDFDEPVRLHLVVPTGTAAVDLPPRVRPADHHNLVRPTTDLVDRDAERAEIRELIRPGRLTTITGPGGVGKTRLAIEVTLEDPDRWPDGTWLVDLSATRSSQDVPAAIGDGLGLPGSPTDEPWNAVVRGIGHQELLLVLDNCEQLDDGLARMVNELLADCSGVAILTTSRTPLGLNSEQVVRLRGLSTDTPDAPALELLRQRVGPRATTFDEADAIALCSALDGLPVAIEVASRQLGVSTPGELVTQLNTGIVLPDSRDPTMPERHRSLDRLIHHSETLLSPEALALLRRLTVVASTFDLTTASVLGEFGTGRHSALIEMMLELVDASLVEVVTVEGSSRYRLLKTVRQYERSKVAAGDAVAITRLHATALLGVIGPERPLDRAWKGSMASELDNIRHVADSLLDSGSVGDVAPALELVCSIMQFHDCSDTFRAGVDEALRWLERTDAAIPERAALLADLADLHLRIGELDRVAAVLERAAKLEAVCGLPSWDRVAIVRAKGELALRRGKPLETRRLMRTMLKQELTSRERARLLSLLGVAHYELGELEQAAVAIHAEIDAATDGGLETFLVNAHGNLAEVLMQLGDHRAAAHQQLCCAELLPTDGNVVQHGFTLVMAAQLAAGAERWRDAITLQSVADRLLESSGYEMYEQDRRRRGELVERAKVCLGDQLLAAAQEDGAGGDPSIYVDFATDLLLGIALDRTLPEPLATRLLDQPQETR